MRGAVRRRDVLGHPIVTYRTFGGKVVARAILARADRTFLSIIREVHRLEGRPVYVPEVVERCIDLELRARDVYAGLAGRFPERSAARRCFERLAVQESEHAELLELCREVAARGRWDAVQLRPLEARVDRLEAEMASTERDAERVESLTPALRTAIAIEGSEINAAFRTIVRSCDSEFVRALRPFRRALQLHLGYLRRQVERLDPSLVPELESVERELEEE